MKLLRLCKGECCKMRHTVIPALHIFIPLIGSALFLWYYRSSLFAVEYQVALFVQVMGLAYPFLVSLVCSRSIHLEEGNHFQTFLGGTSGKGRALFAKCVVLQIMGLCAVVIGVGSLALGEVYVLGNAGIPGTSYLYTMMGLWLGSLVLYPIHMFLSLKFSGAISLGIGVVQSLLAGLLITGLGDGIWWFFPSSWSIRLSLQWAHTKTTLICMLIMFVVYVIIFVWFHSYEGRQCND